MLFKLTNLISKNVNVFRNYSLDKYFYKQMLYKNHADLQIDYFEFFKIILYLLDLK